MFHRVESVVASAFPRRMAYRSLVAALAVLTLGMAPSAAPAGSPGSYGETAAVSGGCQEASADAECMEVLIDHLHLLELRQATSTVLVGNPGIADVTMIATSQAVITARTVGATNILFLDDLGRPIGNYQLFVREPEARRVVLHRGPAQTYNYQCAPNCQRTLSQTDEEGSHGALTKQIQNELDLSVNATAATLSSGAPEGGEE